jgi:hypothetical protein
MKKVELMKRRAQYCAQKNYDKKVARSKSWTSPKVLVPPATSNGKLDASKLNETSTVTIASPPQKLDKVRKLETTS